jgi:uncharacterized protein (DUF1778 family)
MQKKPGRPPVKDADRRDRRLPFMVTQKECDLLNRAATKAGMTLSTWVRWVVMKAAKK